MDLNNTKWTHNSNNDFTGKVVKHNQQTGRIVLRLDTGGRVRTRVGNLRENWTQQ